MAVINHLQNVDRSGLQLEDAYGEHLASGDRLMSEVAGTAESFNVFGLHALGRGIWQGCFALYYDGFNIPAADWRFYDGGTNQGLETFHFDKFRVPDGAVCIAFKLPAGLGNFNDRQNPYDASKLAGRFLCRKTNDYDQTGNSLAFNYSPNPQRVMLDLLIERGGIDPALIDFDNARAWLSFCANTESVDYRGKIEKGIGLRAAYFNGTNFEVLVKERIEPSLYFPQSSGAPVTGLNIVGFSARYWGFIRVETSGDYVFRALHDDGVRVRLNNNLIIENWAANSGVTPDDSAAVALTAGVFYEFSVEWYNTDAAPPNPSALEISFRQPGNSLFEIITPKYFFPAVKNQPRYETHLRWAAPTTLEAAVADVLFNSNSVMNFDGEKYRFYCYEQLTPSFDFNESNILSESNESTLVISPVDKRSRVNPRRNRWTADGRDLESQYLEALTPPPEINRPQAQELVGRIVDGASIPVSNMTRYQALKILEIRARRESDVTFEIEFDASRKSFPVLNNDLVRVTHSLSGWINKSFMVGTAVDYSAESTAGKRRFVLYDWEPFDFAANFNQTTGGEK